MSVHIDQMTSEVGVSAGELPLSPAQIEKLVAILLRRLDQRDRERQRLGEATAVRPQAAPSR
jgi:hypothetical protein